MAECLHSGLAELYLMNELRKHNSCDWKIYGQWHSHDGMFPMASTKPHLRC